MLCEIVDPLKSAMNQMRTLKSYVLPRASKTGPRKIVRLLIFQVSADDGIFVQFRNLHARSPFNIWKELFRTGFGEFREKLFDRVSINRTYLLHLSLKFWRALPASCLVEPGNFEWRWRAEYRCMEAKRPRGSIPNRTGQFLLTVHRRMPR